MIRTVKAKLFCKIRKNVTAMCPWSIYRMFRLILRIATHNSSTWYPVKTTTNARGRSTRWSGRSWCTGKPAVAGDRGEPEPPARAGRRGEKVKISAGLTLVWMEHFSGLHGHVIHCCRAIAKQIRDFRQYSINLDAIFQKEFQDWCVLL